MFKQLFEAMNEVLDEIILAYPTATGAQEQQISEHLSMLKSLSDTYIEEWLLFEEKLGKIYGNTPIVQQLPVQASNPTSKPISEPNLQVKQAEEIGEGAFAKGQGYYKLGMYGYAVDQFEEVARDDPECTMARLYLALCYFQMGDQDQANQHFSWICDFFEHTMNHNKSASFCSLS